MIVGWKTVPRAVFPPTARPGAVLGDTSDMSAHMLPLLSMPGTDDHRNVPGSEKSKELTLLLEVSMSNMRGQSTLPQPSVRDHQRWLLCHIPSTPPLSRSPPPC